MLARGAETIPEGAFLYEPKWDGFRALVVRDGDELRIDSRNGQPLLRYFPELLDPLRAALPQRCVVDGEIIIATGHGLDFDALQMRLHPAASRVARLAAETPAQYVAFDLLIEGDDDLRETALHLRRGRLVAALHTDATVLLTPQTDDANEAAIWFSAYEGAGLDGVVAKDPEGTYRPGIRGWTKVKHLRTVDVVVGGYRTESKGPGVASLLLGLYEGDVFHFVGHTSGFAARERRELLERLIPLHGESYGEGRTPGGPSRWSRAQGGRDADWQAVRPELVCEVSFDHMQGPRFRHASRFLRWRPDKPPSECTFDQLDRPADFDLGSIISGLARG